METVTERLGLPEELLDGASRLTLIGGNQVRIENYQCLLSYTAETLEVGSGRLRLRIRGEGLRICSMNREELLIEGTILAVEVDGA